MGALLGDGSFATMSPHPWHAPWVLVHRADDWLSVVTWLYSFVAIFCQGTISKIVRLNSLLELIQRNGQAKNLAK